MLIFLLQPLSLIDRKTNQAVNLTKMRTRRLMYCAQLVLIVLCNFFAASARAFDLDAYVKQQSAEQLNVIMYGLLGSFALILLALLALLFTAARNKKLRRIQQQQHDELLDKVPAGILQVNLAGKITAVNASGARYLGRPVNKLIGMDLASCFASANASDIEASLQDSKMITQVQAIASNLYLSLHASEMFTHTDSAYRAVTLANSNALNRACIQAQSTALYLSDMFAACDYAQVKLELQKDSYIHDLAFDRMLQLNALNEDDLLSTAQPISEFTKHIHNHDAGDWSQALIKAEKQGKTRLKVRLRVQSEGVNGDNGSYIPVSLIIIAQKATASLNSAKESPPKLSLQPSLDALDEETSEQKAEHAQESVTAFTVLIQSEIEHEAQRHKYETLSQQREAMLNAIPHAAYVIDKKGYLLWSNSQFNQLLARIQSEPQSKNLLELGPFPDEVMQLHKNTSFLANHTETKDFELVTQRGASLELKITLGFYTTSDRLSQQKQMGIVGIVQDLSDIKTAREKLNQEREKNLQINSELIEEQEHVVQIGNALKQEKERLAETLIMLDEERTSRTEYEELLAEEKQRMTRFLELAPVAIATINANDQITSANRVMLERLKYTEKELKKGNIYKLFSDPAEAGTTAKQLNKKGYLRDFHVKLRGKDGNLYAGELTVDALQSVNQFDDAHDKDESFPIGNKEYLFWLIDRSDEEFQRSKFESLLQYSDMPMAILEQSGLSKLNQAACDFFGVEDEEDMFGSAPFAQNLNRDAEHAQELAQLIDEVKITAQPKTIEWVHVVGEEEKICLATYVPIYKDHIFDSILCMWSDQSAVHKAESAIASAIAASQSARLEKQEAQTRFELSSEQLSNTIRQLSETEHRLQSLSADKETTQAAFDVLQLDHQETSAHYEKAVQELNEHREKLATVQQSAEALKAEFESVTRAYEMTSIERDELAGKLAKTEADYEKTQIAFTKKESEAHSLYERTDDQAQVMRDLNEALAAKTNELEEQQQALFASNQKLEILQAEHAHIQKNAIEMQQQIEQEQVLVENLEQQLQSLDGNYRQALEQSLQKNEEVQRLEGKLQNAAELDQHVLDALQAKEIALSKELEQKNTELDQAKQALLSAEQKANTAQQENHRLLDDITQLRSNIQEAEQKSDEHEKELLDNEAKLVQHAKLNEEYEQLEQLQRKYATSKEKLLSQHAKLENLHLQMEQFESSLMHSEQALKEKSDQLVEAQKALEASNVELAEKQSALDKAHEQLHEFNASQATSELRPDLASLPLPQPANAWFDAVPYLQTQAPVVSMQAELKSLIDEIEETIDITEIAIQNNQIEGVNSSAKRLITIAKKTQSDALLQLMQSIESDCDNGMFDNVSIRWPAAKSGLQKTLRVVYSHLV